MEIMGFVELTKAARHPSERRRLSIPYPFAFCEANYSDQQDLLAGTFVTGPFGDFRVYESYGQVKIKVEALLTSRQKPVERG